MRARLTYYPPYTMLSAHYHEADQFSVLLLGGFAESTAFGETELCDVRAGFKPAGLAHRNCYGAEGALIFAIDREPSPSSPDDWCWRRPGADQNIAMLTQALLTSNATSADVPDLIEELTSLVFKPAADPAKSCAAPRWLRRARNQIDESPASVSLESLARDAGVHHVHLSRSFAKSYGQPLSIYRRRVMAMRAARILIDDAESPAYAAGAAGFADQSHLNRVMRRELGLTPSRLKRLFSRPTSTG